VPLSQEHVDENTPMGGRLVPGGGATFRVWAPHARAVHLIRDLDGSPDDSNRLVRQTDGRWTGFLPGARSGDLYLFYVEGEGSAGPKRDPHACELTLEPAWPASRCRLLDRARYPWHDAGFRPAPFEDLVIYQLHVGCWWGPDRSRRPAKLLDAAQRVEYLADLGVNAVQLMPVVEFQTGFSMGYNGTDYFSPENDYEVSEPEELAAYLREVNGILARRGRPPLALDEVDGSTAQLKVLVDLCHLHGIAVLLDVV